VHDVLFVGYFGFGNLGDETILGVIARAIAEREPSLRVAALVGPAPVSLPDGVEAVRRDDRRGSKAALAGSRVVCVGPGGVFQDATSIRSCLWYSEMIRRAARSGATIAHIGQSLGPLHTAVARWLTSRALRKARVIAVRDDASLELARELAPGCRILPSADVAWLLGSRIGHDRDAGHVVLAPRPWRAGLVDARWWAELADGLLGCGHTIEWLALAPADARLAEEAGRLMGGEGARPLVRAPESAEAALEVLGRCGVLVGMRLHALILGALAGAALAGISYDPKVDGMLSRVGMAPIGSVRRPPTPSEIAGRAALLAERPIAAAAVEEERRRAQVNVTALLECLNGA
jgi:polysaccharide pyruvyl transferase CsaB